MSLVDFIQLDVPQSETFEITRDLQESIRNMVLANDGGIGLNEVLDMLGEFGSAIARMEARCANIHSDALDKSAESMDRDTKIYEHLTDHRNELNVLAARRR